MSCLDCHDYMDGFNRGKKEGVIEELETIKEKINEFCKGYLGTPQPEVIAKDINEHIIDKRITELKGGK